MGIQLIPGANLLSRIVRGAPDEKGKPLPVNWGEERLTGSGFVSQWGF